MSIPCRNCSNDAIAFESTPMGVGYVCSNCICNDLENEHTYLEED